MGKEDRVGEGEEGTLREAVEGVKDIPVGVEVDPTILERVKKMNAVSMKLSMVR